MHVHVLTSCKAPKRFVNRILQLLLLPLLSGGRGGWWILLITLARFWISSEEISNGFEDSTNAADNGLMQFWAQILVLTFY